MLIIGVGNEYRRDDGAGLEVARRIEALNLPRVRTTAHSGEGASLMERFREADFIVIIDAVRSNCEPGKVHRLDATTSPIPSDFFHYSTHAFSVAEAVEMARALEQLPERLLIYGIEGQDFSSGVGVTDKVGLAIEAVAAQIADDLRQVDSLCQN
jgi:hydrogenase maturation protease